MQIYLTSPTFYEETISFPLIEFQSLQKEVVLRDNSLLLFTSKQAVKEINKINRNWKEHNSLSIGDATTKEIEKFGGKVLKRATNSYIEEFIKEIKDLKNITYLRPQKVSLELKPFFNEDFNEIILYKTVCIKKKNPPKENSIIIFTSPSTVNCFFSQFKWNNSYKAVLIGKTTKKAFPKEIKSYISNKPQIIECIKKAKSILSTTKTGNIIIT